MSNHTLPPATAPRPRPYRFFPVLLLAFLALSAASAVRYLHREPSVTPDAALHGDSDEASGALPQRLPFLLKAAQDPSPGLRFAAIDALADNKTPLATTALEHAFYDSASNVRQRAVETLPDHDPKAGYTLLLTALKDDDTWIREAAASQILTRLGHKPALIDNRAIPALITALDDSSPAVSAFAVSALCKLTGKPWHFRHTDTDTRKAAVRTQWQQWQSTQPTLPDAPTTARRPTRTDPAPTFDLPDTQGKPLTLAAQTGRITLLNFWGTWCPPCQQEIPDLIKVDQQYRTRGVDVIGIALAETSTDTLTAWCRSHHVAYRQAMATQPIKDAFGHIEEVPISVLLDAQGRIRYRWEGERDVSTFRAAIDHLLQEEAKPAQTATPSLSTGNGATGDGLAVSQR